MDQGRWFFRAIETAEGWACRHGTVVFDSHPTLAKALEHLAEIASASAPAQVYIHYLDGRIETAGTYD
jgi:hypothetical protein